MDNPFVIQIDTLKGGSVKKFNASFSSDFLDVNESDLCFKDKVQVSGETYLTDEDLVIHFNASTFAQIPCSICNRWVSLPLSVNGFYHTEPLTEIPGVIFDFRSIIREALLVELPKIAECNGNCSERKDLSSYLHSKTPKDDSNQYFPFNDLKFPTE